MSNIIKQASTTQDQIVQHLKGFAVTLAPVINGDGTYTLTVTGNDAYGGIWPYGHLHFNCDGAPNGSKCLVDFGWKATGTVQSPPIIDFTGDCAGYESQAQAFDDQHGISSNTVAIPC